jgi:acetyl-CoA acetyltransferase
MTNSTLEPCSVVISGIGEAPRTAPRGAGSLDLCADAIVAALNDAGIEKGRVDGLLTGYTLSEPYPFYSSALAERLGVRPSFQQTICLGGATGAALVESAAMALRTGRCTTAVVVWGDNRSSSPEPGQMVARFAEIGTQPDFEMPQGASIPAMYALVAERHMATFGTTQEDLAAVAVAARGNAALHPNAVKRTRITVEDVLASPDVATPLHVLDCCLITDFAVALVLTARGPGAPLDDDTRAVRLLGYGQGFTHEFLSKAPRRPGQGAAVAAHSALKMAGVRLADLDFVELYDCFTITPLILLEEIGFCGPGESGDMIRSGATNLAGHLPMNTHGGLLSYGSGGITHIAEAVTQLRGEAGARQVKDAELGLVHNLGGILSLHVTLVLGRNR